MSNQLDFAKYFTGSVVKDAPRADREAVKQASKRKVDAPSQPKAEQVAKLKNSLRTKGISCSRLSLARK